jgi:hypothetical protein
MKKVFDYIYQFKSTATSAGHKLQQLFSQAAELANRTAGLT